MIFMGNDLQFQFDFKKSVQVANFLIRKCGNEESVLKIMKLVFFADKAHLLKHGRTITGDDYFAMPHGPVASSTYDTLKGEAFGEDAEYFQEFIEVDGKHLKSISHVDEDEFSDSDIEILEEIFEKYGSYSAWELREMTHDEPEWKDNWEKRGQAQRIKIPLKDFFHGLSEDSISFRLAVDHSEALEYVN